MKALKEEYTLKHIRMDYRLGHMDKELVITIEENIRALEAGLDDMIRLRTYTGVMCGDVLNTELKRYTRTYNKMKREYPEYFM